MTFEDYPKVLRDFEQRFRTEEDCLAYIRSIRWPDGFMCPRCHGRKAWEHPRRLLECSTCGAQVSVTAGTIFHGTRKPLKLWFDVMWWLVSQKNGASAKNLKDAMGFGSYQTAWTWLHKLRRAMIRPGRSQLRGTVEVDEAFIGGREAGKPGRKPQKKSLLVVAVEGKSPEIGRVRFRRIPNASRQHLIPFIVDYVEPGAGVRTDGWKGYDRVSQHGFRHERKKTSQTDKEPSELMPNVHRVISLLKRWLLGTHQGAVRAKHLPCYLDEFAFRFNRRMSTHRGKLFFRLMQNAVTHDATPYKDIVAKPK